MTLTLITLVLLVLVMPGMGFRFGLYHGGRITRNVSPSGSLSNIALVLITAILAHAIVLFSLVIVEKSINPQWLTDCKEAVRSLLQAIWGNDQSGPWSEIRTFVFFTFGYVLFASLIGTGLGYGFIRNIDKGSMRLTAFHGALYDHIVGPEPPVMLAHVLTKVEHEGRILMYRGFVKEIGLEKGRKVAYIVLIGAARFFMKMDSKGDHPQTSDKTDYKIIGLDKGQNINSSTTKTTLLIDGEEISNVVLNSYQIKVPKKSKLKAWLIASKRQINPFDSE